MQRGDLDVAAGAGAPFADGSYIVTTVSRMGGVDTDAAEKFQYKEPARFAELEREAKKIIRGMLGLLVAEDALAGDRVVQLSAT